MNHRERLLAMLERVAEALGEDLDRVVFVGGIVASFHASSVRLTEDVDCIVDMAMPAYYQLGQRLRARGFREDSSGGVICRWIQHDGAPVCEALREELKAMREPLLRALIYHLSPEEQEEVQDALATWLLAL